MGDSYKSHSSEEPTITKKKTVNNKNKALKIRNLALEISSVDLKSVISQEMCQLHAQKRIRCWQKDEDNRIHHLSTMIVDDSKTTSKRRPMECRDKGRYGRWILFPSHSLLELPP